MVGGRASCIRLCGLDMAVTYYTLWLEQGRTYIKIFNSSRCCKCVYIGYLYKIIKQIKSKSDKTMLVNQLEKKKCKKTLLSR